MVLLHLGILAAISALKPVAGVRFKEACRDFSETYCGASSSLFASHVRKELMDPKMQQNPTYHRSS